MRRQLQLQKNLLRDVARRRFVADNPDSLVSFGLDKPQYLNPSELAKRWAAGERNPFTLTTAYLDSQFFGYLGNALTGDLGPSYRQRGKSVQDILRQQWPYSLRLGLFALVVAVAVGVPLGVLAALKQNTIFDYVSLLVATVGISVPPAGRTPKGKPSSEPRRSRGP